MNEEPASKDELWGSRTKGRKHDQVQTSDEDERKNVKRGTGGEARRGEDEEMRDEETRRDGERRGEAREKPIK
jgi:hypothetical protein